MSTNVYQNILLALDLHNDCDKTTIDRAVKIAQTYNASLSLVHAVVHINAYGIAQAYPVVLNIEEDQVDVARTQLAKVGAQLAVPAERLFVEIGSPKSIIIQKAIDIKADLIIVGSHGRHGISLLLGSTANAVLHHANCDVLAIRVSDENHQH